VTKYNRETVILDNDLYYEILQERGQKFFKIHKTKTFEALRGQLIPVLATHLWTRTDKLHKLSQKYYGNNNDWWIIGMFNKKPTDAHFNIGDEVLIPSNPLVIITLLEAGSGI